MSNPTEKTESVDLVEFGSGPDLCPKCLHDDLGVKYQPDTSHWGCPLAKRLSTSYGPEHFDRWCKRCGFHWEEAVIGKGVRAPQRQGQSR